MWLIISLIVIGLLLLVAELVLLPGISIAGIAAFLALCGAIAYAYISYGVLIGSIVLTVVVVFCVAAVVLSLRANTWKRLSLRTTIDSKSTPSLDGKLTIGEEGRTLTRLAPMGNVIINDHIYEARSLDSYIDQDQPIEVTALDNTVVIVKKNN